MEMALSLDISLQDREEGEEVESFKTSKTR